MIAKRARENIKWKGSYQRLAHYILREGKAESIDGAWVTNCGFNDYASAIKEIAATQAINTRASTENDKTYHLVVSFPAGEKPDIETLKAIETELCQKIGLDQHQRISAVHNDTDHYHLHVAINKVHPRTYNLIEPYYDKKKLVAAAQALEIKHGLVKNIDWNKPKDKNQQRRSSKPDTALSSHTGTQSFKDWVQDLKPKIQEALKPAGSWQEFHKALAQFDLIIRIRANGLSLSSRSHKAYIKASDFDRNIALKKLEERFGAYQEPDNALKDTPPLLQYTQRPKQAITNGLWESFQAAMVAKKEQRDSLQGNRKQSMDALYQAYSHRREAIKNDKFLNKRSKQATYQLLKQTYQNERKALAEQAKAKQAALFEQYPYRSWQDFLMHEASNGNAHALQTLRSSKVAEKLSERFTVWGEQDRQTTLLFPALKPRVTKNGDILYHVGTINIRDNGRLHTDDDSEAAISLTLRLARHKYGNVLDVQGNSTFKRQVVECAVAQQMLVTFTDPLMEQYRQRLNAIQTDRQAESSAQVLDTQKPVISTNKPSKPTQGLEGR